MMASAAAFAPPMIPAVRDLLDFRTRSVLNGCWHNARHGLRRDEAHRS
jgi:hypothetical protein